MEYLDFKYLQKNLKATKTHGYCLIAIRSRPNRRIQQPWANLRAKKKKGKTDTDVPEDKCYASGCDRKNIIKRKWEGVNEGAGGGGGGGSHNKGIIQILNCGIEENNHRYD